MTHYDHQSRSRRQGFTLIEIMIAIALGAMVVYVAFAGLRVASQSISMVNRMAIENALIRSGMQVAHDHLDFWTDCDEPTNPNPAGNRFRSRDLIGGKPFTPMTDVFPYAGSLNPELITGWNPRETWSAYDPRQWWRGNQGEHNQMSVHIAGRYALFSNSKSPVTLLAGIIPAPIPPAVAYGTVTVARSWLSNQTWGMLTALGYYGYFDYMPANLMYSCHTIGDPKPAPFNGLTEGGTPQVFLNAHKVGGQVSPLNLGSAIDAIYAPAGLWRRTTFGFKGLPLDANPGTHRKTYFTGYGSGANPVAMRNFLNEVDNNKALLDSGGPANWPNTAVSIRRFIKSARFVSLCTIKWTSPLTGESAQLVFSGFGTSLRGARQQRHETLPKWAEWDGCDNPNNDRTLDGAP